MTELAPVLSHRERYIDSHRGIEGETLTKGGVLNIFVEMTVLKRSLMTTKKQLYTDDNNQLMEQIF